MSKTIELGLTRGVEEGERMLLGLDNRVEIGVVRVNDARRLVPPLGLLLRLLGPLRIAHEREDLGLVALAVVEGVLATRKVLDGGEALDLEALAERLLRGRVHEGDHALRLLRPQLPRHTVEHGLHGLAVAAPRRIELDQH